jgi:hypothetical protein
MHLSVIAKEKSASLFTDCHGVQIILKLEAILFKLNPSFCCILNINLLPLCEHYYVVNA